MTTVPRLLLASQSESRRRLLVDAGVPFETVRPDINEDVEKDALLAAGLHPAALAEALAMTKAVAPSLGSPGVLVLGCDQTLELDDGSLVSKCADKAEARELLLRMSGRRHYLHAALCVAEDGATAWRHRESVAMDVRELSPGFIDAYLDADWENCRWCVGCYRVEGPGAQLFSDISGSLFAVQGLPLLPLLDFLRVRGVLAA
jgi:septum formation protein